jgi:hypothetical protein
MSHLHSQIKGGYYPFPAQHLPALASLFTASGGGLILDPCAGEGDALDLKTKGYTSDEVYPVRERRGWHYL